MIDIKTQLPPIFTIGYGSRSIDEFIRTLGINQISFLIDVRSKPYSKFKPEFSKDALEKRISASGIRYVFMGDLLGGQPDIRSVYTEDGKVDYSKVKVKDFFIRGIQRLQDARAKNLRVALMCSEGKPEMCHRSKLIGVTLIELGIEVVHIDENSYLISQDEAILRLTSGQMSLFGSEIDTFTSRKSYQPGNQESEDDES